MRILVTGVSGTLGRPLAKELIARGHDVYGCSTNHLGDVPWTHLRADVGNYRQLERCFQDCSPEIVYHLAAEFGRVNGEHFYEQLWQTNVIGTRNIAELCIAYNVKLILASSSEVYGDVYHGPLSEDMTIDMPPTQWNDYAISKWVNELQVRHLSERTGLKAMVLRFFNAYGPGEAYHPYRSVVCVFCHSLLNDEPITVYKGYTRSFMFIDDFIPTLANACDRFTQTIINIGGAERRSVDELAEIVLTATNASRDLIGYENAEALNVVDKIAEISRARKILGHNPKITLEEGVPLTVEWMRGRS